MTDTPAPPVPFSVFIPEETIARILAQVRAYRMPPVPADEGDDDWSRGMNGVFLTRLRQHWLEQFDWWRWEARLNAWPQYTADIEGQRIHFYHVVGEAGGRRPLLITHGWPGSVVEFLDVIEPLAFPSRHGGDPADAFDLVIPSLPGYGFSGAPARPIGQRATARLWRQLMELLGYDRFVAQGGDWGSLVTSWLGLDHADAVQAIHLNMIGLRPTPATPQSPEEIAWLTRMGQNLQIGGAYFQQQATKPQTLAFALADSPMGQAAWILEKFHGWSDLTGGRTLESVYGLDRLLANVMVYLVTGSFGTSVWYYRALMEENGGNGLPDGRRVEVPTGFANFPGESLYVAPPRSWAERAYQVVRWTDMPRGGHFAAMECPDLFVDELRAFARQIGYAS